MAIREAPDDGDVLAWVVADTSQAACQTLREGPIGRGRSGVQQANSGATRCRAARQRGVVLLDPFARSGIAPRSSEHGPCFGWFIEQTAPILGECGWRCGLLRRGRPGRCNECDKCKQEQQSMRSQTCGACDR